MVAAHDGSVFATDRDLDRRLGVQFVLGIPASCLVPKQRWRRKQKAKEEGPGAQAGVHARKLAGLALAVTERSRLHPDLPRSLALVWRQHSLDRGSLHFPRSRRQCASVVNAKAVPYG